MAAQILSVLCWLFGLILIAAGSLVMNVDPREIIPGLTHFLTIKCSFSVDGVSEFAGLISLIIAKENQQEQCEDLVSANIFRPDEIKGADQLTGSSSVTGHISGDGQSFLAIQWSMPTSSEAGRYVCQVNGVNNDGHPTEKSQSMNVTSQKPDFDQLTNKVSDLQHQLDGQDTLIQNLQHQLDLQETLIQNQSQTIDTLLSLTQTQSDTITTLMNTATDLKEQVKLHSFALSFYVSKEYQGHLYLLSKERHLDNRQDCILRCYACNGYLVEINDSDEHEFVKEFIHEIKEEAGMDFVMISGEIRDNTGTWVYHDSGDPLTYSDWRSGDPHEGAGCIVMWLTGPKESWQWISVSCGNNRIDWACLCEFQITDDLA